MSNAYCLHLQRGRGRREGWGEGEGEGGGEYRVSYIYLVRTSGAGVRFCAIRARKIERDFVKGEGGGMREGKVVGNALPDKTICGATFFFALCKVCSHGRRHLLLQARTSLRVILSARVVGAMHVGFAILFFPIA